MKKLADRDLGIECDHVASGNNDNDVIRMATEHIRKEHPEEFDRVKGQLKDKIKSE